VGLIKAPPVIVNNGEVEELIELPKSARANSRLSFTVGLADGIEVPWECWMKNNNLFVDVPANLPLYGSKDSFVALLEYSEESLKVDHVVVTLSKSRPDRADLIRLFMFFGFAPVPPTHSLLPSVPGDDNIYLAYQAN
jgi:hypothetical protein